MMHGNHYRPAVDLAIVAALVVLGWIVAPADVAIMISIAVISPLASLLLNLRLQRGELTEADADRAGAALPASNAAAAEPAFLGDLSHELRTPMNAIMGYIDLLSETPLGPRQRSYVDALGAAGNNLADIVEDLLNLSRSNAENPELHEQSFSVRDCIDSVIQMLAPSAYEKKLDFFHYVDPDIPPALLGDPLRIRQILVNLLTNAIKFTAQGHVRLMVLAAGNTRTRQQLLIEVSDTGIGIPDHQQSRLFTPFARVAPEHEGTGLGLVITRRLCQAMQGDCAFRSSYGAGSTFSARIWLHRDPATAVEPVAAERLPQVGVIVCCPDPHTEQALRYWLECEGATVTALDSDALLDTDLSTADMLVLYVDQQTLHSPERLATLAGQIGERIRLIGLASSSSGYLLQDLERVLGGPVMPAHVSPGLVCQRLVDLRQSLPVTATAAAAAHDRLAGRHILVVDDDAVSRGYLRDLLEHDGAAVDSCHNGKEAFGLLRANAYDLILLDVRMPGMSGIEMVTRMREEGRHIPVVGLTAAMQERDAALAAGMNACLLKPARSAEIMACLQRMIREVPHERLHRLDHSMLEALQRELPQQAARMRAATAAADFDSLLEHAHRLHGSAALCGFYRLMQLARSVENEIRAGNLSAVATPATRLIEETERVAGQISEIDGQLRFTGTP